MTSKQDAIKELEQILEAMAHPGYRLLEERLADAYEQQDKVLILSDEKQLFMAQGRLMTLGQMIQLRETIREEIERLEAPDENEGNTLENDSFSENFVSEMKV